jgi:hypothetical protein
LISGPGNAFVTMTKDQSFVQSYTLWQFRVLIKVSLPWTLHKRLNNYSCGYSFPQYFSDQYPLFASRIDSENLFHRKQVRWQLLFKEHPNLLSVQSQSRHSKIKCASTCKKGKLLPGFEWNLFLFCSSRE